MKVGPFCRKGLSYVGPFCRKGLSYVGPFCRKGLCSLLQPATSPTLPIGQRDAVERTSARSCLFCVPQCFTGFCSPYESGRWSFRTGICFARASSLANFGFSTSIPFAAIVRQFDFRMLNKHEQTINVVGQLSLKKMILQHQFDGLANQMSPAQLVFAEQTLVRRVVIGHADAVKGSSQDARRFGLLSRNSAAKQHMFGGRKNPCVTGFCADFPAGFVNVHNRLQSDLYGGVTLFCVRQRQKRTESQFPRIWLIA